MTQLLSSARERNKLVSIRNKLKKPGGGVYNGVSEIDSSWLNEYLGETKHKLILASKGVTELTQSPNELTAIGGWCAVRTKCMKQIAQGKIIQPSTGIEIDFNASTQIEEWLRNAISADQIVEAIGIFSGNKYAAISEVTLWTEKIYNSIKLRIKDKKNNLEESIYEAVLDAESKRFNSTLRYLKYVTGREIEFNQIIDTDIMGDIRNERDIMLNELGITIQDLVLPMISRRFKNQVPEKKIYSDLIGYIDSYSLVWFMYTGRYLSLLRKRGYVSTSNALIIEPWSHAASNESEIAFNECLFAKDNGKNNYLQKNGMNENIAYIAIDEVSDYYWNKSKNELNINEVPNPYNFRNIIETALLSPRASSIFLSENPIFMLGLNYLPYGSVLNKLFEMLDIQSDFLRLKRIYKNINDEDEFINLEVAKAKTSKDIQNISFEIAEELLTMFSNVFKEIDI